MTDDWLTRLMFAAVPVALFTAAAFLVIYGVRL